MMQRAHQPAAARLDRYSAAMTDRRSNPAQSEDSSPVPALPPSDTLSVSTLLLSSKRLQIDSARLLARRAELVDQIGRLIHVLQTERGASSVCLSTGGTRFVQLREQAVHEAAAAEQALRAGFSHHVSAQQGSSARMLDLMAWALLGLEGLDELRGRIQSRQVSAVEAVSAYSRLIGGLLELIGELADAALLPAISRLLVALLHLVQGTELTGQERLVGVELFAGGRCDEVRQQQLHSLIDAQERSLGVFEAFVQGELLERWNAAQQAPELIHLERLRRRLCSARSGAALEPRECDVWFEVCSQRIGGLRRLQEELVRQLREECDRQVLQAEQELQDSQGLLLHLRQRPPAHADAAARFLDPELPTQPVPTLIQATAPASWIDDPAAAHPEAAGLQELLRQQSARLSQVEAELEATRRTLAERRLVDRAKAVLMSRIGLSEELAFRTLQKASMDQNRRLVEVAQALLALPDLSQVVSGTGREPDAGQRRTPGALRGGADPSRGR